MYIFFFWVTKKKKKFESCDRKYYFSLLLKYYHFLSNPLKTGQLSKESNFEWMSSQIMYVYFLFIKLPNFEWRR